MGLQLIFVVETNKRVNSDWIYIKDTIERFYEYSRTQIKLTPVYMDGRGKYKKKTGFHTETGLSFICFLQFSAVSSCQYKP